MIDIMLDVDDIGDSRLMYVYQERHRKKSWTGIRRWPLVFLLEKAACRQHLFMAATQVLMAMIFLRGMCRPLQAHGVRLIELTERKEVLAEP